MDSNTNRRDFLKIAGAGSIGGLAGCIGMRNKEKPNNLEINVYQTEATEMAAEYAHGDAQYAQKVAKKYLEHHFEDVLYNQDYFDGLEVTLVDEAIKQTFSSRYSIIVRELEWDEYIDSRMKNKEFAGEKPARHANILLDTKEMTSPIAGLAICKDCQGMLGSLCSLDTEQSNSSMINFAQRLLDIPLDEDIDKTTIYKNGKTRNSAYFIADAIPHEVMHNVCGKHIYGTAEAYNDPEGEGNIVEVSSMMGFYYTRMGGLPNSCGEEIATPTIHKNKQGQAHLYDTIMLTHEFSDCAIKRFEEKVRWKDKPE